MIWAVTMRGRIGKLILDLELGGGAEPVALIGPNGAGKTTLLRWIAGGPCEASGEIRVGGDLLFSSRAMLALPPDQRRVGYVPQGYGLFPHLCGMDNVAFGLDSRGRTRRERRASALELLERLGAGGLARRRPPTMSGGERQKVALARALAVEPRLLLLDEPMAALDPSSRRRTREFLRKELSDLGAPAIIVTHDPRDVAAMAEKVFVMENGSIIQSGTASDLARSPRTDFVAEFFTSFDALGARFARQSDVRPRRTASPSVRSVS